MAGSNPGINDHPADNSIARDFMRFIEEETKAETEKIMKKYRDLMDADLKAAQQKIVANASIRLSEIMTVQDLGRTIRIEIIKREEPRNG